MFDSSALESINRSLKAEGMPLLDIVDPASIKPQALNARYMDQQTMNTLVSNVKRDGRLESVPLVTGSREQGYQAISGHHRIEAAVAAGLKAILVMVVSVKDESELRAKQLSHNAITGKDDPATLKQIYDRITDLALKVYSGLQDDLKDINITSLNFKPGAFKELVMMFIPEDIKTLDQANDFAKQSQSKGSSEVRVYPIQAYNLVTEALRMTKKVMNIKSNGSAMAAIATIALNHMRELEAEEAAKQEKADGEK